MRKKPSFPRIGTRIPYTKIHIPRPYKEKTKIKQLKYELNLMEEENELQRDNRIMGANIQDEYEW